MDGGDHPRRHSSRYLSVAKPSARTDPSDAYYKLISLDFDDMLLIAYGDPAWANDPGGTSHGY